MKPIFEYLNYRDYLRDTYTSKKAEHSYYSFRLFSEKAGFKSPNFLKLVIDNKRNLTKESVTRFVKGLSLNRQEADYFENVVFFNQSKTLEEKNLYLNNLLKYRARTDPKKIEQSEYAYYSAWYHPVIRELATAIDFKGDYKKLGQSVVPAISATDAEKSVKLLLSLNFIKKAGTAFVKTEAVLSTGLSVRSVGVATYHKEMIRLGRESIERFPASQRTVESLTLSVSLQTYKAIIEKTRQFSMELLDMARNDDRTETVAVVNFQVFPMSDPIQPKDVTP